MLKFQATTGARERRRRLCRAVVIASGGKVVMNPYGLGPASAMRQARLECARYWRHSAAVVCSPISVPMS